MLGAGVGLLALVLLFRRLHGIGAAQRTSISICDIGARCSASNAHIKKKKGKKVSRRADSSTGHYETLPGVNGAELMNQAESPQLAHSSEDVDSWGADAVVSAKQ